jgi:hypothetical protein
MTTVGVNEPQCDGRMQRLRQLERDGFVSRTYHAVMPPRIEWSGSHLDKVREARRQFEHANAAVLPIRPQGRATETTLRQRAGSRGGRPTVLAGQAVRRIRDSNS